MDHRRGEILNLSPKGTHMRRVAIIVVGGIVVVVPHLANREQNARFDTFPKNTLSPNPELYDDDRRSGNKREKPLQRTRPRERGSFTIR